MFSELSINYKLSMTSRRHGIVWTHGAALALLVSAAGCSSLGANVMRNSRLDYNAAVQRSDEEQLLANLVRLRYTQSPSFLEIDSITTQFSIGGEVTASSNREEERASNRTAGTTLEDAAETTIGQSLERVSGKTITDAFSFGGTADFSSTPTVTFTPLKGEEFLTRLLSPIQIEKIMLLYHSGWRLKRILSLTVQSMNGIPNATRASGPAPENAPEFREFEEAVNLMHALESKELLELTFEPYEDKKSVESVLLMRPEAWTTPEAKRLTQLLRIEPGRDHYDIAYRSFSTAATETGGAITLETRSVLGVLLFLSQGIQVPDDDLRKGIVRVTYTDDGKPFDWTEIFGNTFTVRSSNNRPTSAAVAVRYRGAWFYIDDSDLSTKATFMLVSQLLALQSGSGKALTPILTIPAGR